MTQNFHLSISIHILISIFWCNFSCHYHSMCFLFIHCIHLISPFHFTSFDNVTAGFKKVPLLFAVTTGKEISTLMGGILHGAYRHYRALYTFHFTVINKI